MAADQEEHFLPRLPFRKRNQEAVFRIPTSIIEGPDELLSYRNEVPIRERIAADLVVEAPAFEFPSAPRVAMPANTIHSNLDVP